MDQSPEVNRNVGKLQAFLGKDFSEKNCQILVHGKTGSIEVPQRIHELEERLSKERKGERDLSSWKEVQLNVSSVSGKPHFGVVGLEALEIGAQKVIRASLEILNGEAPAEKGALPERELETLPGWAGRVDRMGAEKLLRGCPVGTYLLREADSIIQSSTFHMAKENHLAVHPFILTIVEEGGKISDILLLKTEKGWLIFADDPNLEDPEIYKYFPSVALILVEMNQIAKFPLRSC